MRDGEVLELHEDTLKSEDDADDYARLVALAHPGSHVELRNRDGIVREYGPLTARPQ